MTSTGDVQTRIEHGVGRITLNRPKAMNALTTEMFGEIQRALTAWAEDPSVRFVVLDGAGDRGLCAGGDVRMIWESARSGGATAREFFRAEYTVNALIARYSKPYVALMDGVVMGGGVGVSSHGSVRVVSERAMVGMPEVTIGFVPDVGGTYLLSRAPGQSGTHVALTGAPISGADSIYAGLADHYVRSEKLPALVEALLESVAADVSAFSEQPPPSTLEAHRGWIDSCYRFDTVAEIVRALRANGDPAAGEAATTIEAKSPVALSVTLEALRRAARASSLEDVLEQEFRVSSAALGSHDLVEGIRAQVIDKDRAPKWQPASLAEVDADEVAAYFSDSHGRLGLPTRTEGVRT
jgi:enoyl-CoA hydratase